MLSIQEVALQKSLTMLKAAGAEFIVVLPDGQEIVHGNLKLASGKTRVQRVKKGTYLKIYEETLKKVQVGEIAVIAAGMHDIDALRGALTGWCSHHWGNGNYITHIKDNTVEVMRTA